MLSNSKIIEAIENGLIEISPFSPDQLNPNSYDLRLGPWVSVYQNKVLDAAKPQKLATEKIGNGITLYPGELYLMATQEYTYSKAYIPCIEGRSSVGRLGINVHATAGFGDIGFKGTWTLEVSVIRPVKIYEGMRICQIYFEECSGEPLFTYAGKYNGQKTPKASGIYKEKNEWVTPE